MAITCPDCHFENPAGSEFCLKCNEPLNPLKTKPSDKEIESENEINENTDTGTKTLKKHVPKTLIGTTVSGKYEILEKLGQGGMGVVYKAEDKKLNRLMALKFFPFDITIDPEDKHRFIQEAQTASKLDHPNICTIHGIDETEEGQLYIAMSFYEGENLKERIKRGPLPIDDLISILLQIVQGLEKAHQEDIVHRDVKPSNIMITRDGAVKILDFGLAKLQGGTKITQTAAILGTIPYMSPEQTQGQEVDQRTDVWSTGVVLYKALTGQLPFKGTAAVSIINAIMNKSPIPPMELRKDIPEELERIVYKCLRKDKKERYDSAAKLFADLENLKRALALGAKNGILKEEREPIRKETERRLATVAFIEITGIYEMMGNKDPEEMSSLLDPCLKLIDTVFEKYSGHVNKVTGNTLMGFFGVPVAVENTPRKAVNAAIEIRNGLSRLKKQLKATGPLDARIGINTGMVIAGMDGRAEKEGYSIMGETVNIASRLMDFSTKGKIYVGSLTHRYTRDEFDYGQSATVTVQDETEGVQAYELLSVKEKLLQIHDRKERMIFSDMVGRDREIDKLEFHVLKALNGEGSIVNVIGEAGIGKSRLIAELGKKESITKVNYIIGRALSIGRNLSFYPIIDILKMWAQVKEDDSPRTVSQKIEAAIRDIHPEGVAETFPFIARLMGIKLTGAYAERAAGIEGEALEKLILKSLRELVIQSTTRRPLVIVLEDLHWADSTSIELIESLYRIVESHPVLFINVFRPNFKETSDKLQRKIRERYETKSIEIHLDPLNENQCEDLIENLLKSKDIPERIKRLITLRAEGNPFFVEEIIRSLIDENILEISRGRFKLTKNIDSVVIPETIKDLLMSRIDKLDEGTNSLLKIASVIGRSFFLKILRDVAKNIQDVDEKIEFLKDSQLILERKRMEEVEYLFKHALVQEVTYESILLKKRKELHLKIAASIESIFSDRLPVFYGFLAFHYSLGENLEKAREYLTKAGEEALKAAASSEALNYCQQALRLYFEQAGKKDMEVITQLEKNIAIALYNKGDMDQSVPYFARVLKTYGERFPKSKLAIQVKLISNLAGIVFHLYFRLRKSKTAPTPKVNEIVELTFKRSTALSSVDTQRMFIDSISVLKSLTKLDLIQIPNGISIYYHGSALFSFSGISFHVAKKLLDYPALYIKDVEKTEEKGFRFAQLMHGILSGTWTKELEYKESAVDSALKFGQVWSASAYLLWSAILQTEQGNFEGVRACRDKLSQIGEDYDNDFARARNHLTNIRLNIKMKRFSDALAEIEKGKDSILRTGHMNGLLILSKIAYIQILQKDMTGAEETLERAERFVSGEKRVSPYHIGSYLLSRFLFNLMQLEEFDQAEDRTEWKKLRQIALRSGKAVVRNTKKYPITRIEGFKLMGVFFWLVEKPKKALGWWKRSIQEGEKLGAKPELARVYWEIGRRILEKGSRVSTFDGKWAEDLIALAKKMFKEMELHRDLEELEGMALDIE